MTKAIELPGMEAIPVKLRERQQWVAWQYKPDGKSKLPIDAKTGKPASVTEPGTWTTYGRAYRFAKNRRAGIGYVFTKNDPFCGVDFDRCRDGAGVIQVAIYEDIASLNSYAEVSPSGHGVKVICAAKLDRAHKNAKIELYDRGRFFTLTGNHVKGTSETINEAQRAVEVLIERHFRSQRHSSDAITGRIIEGERNSTLTSLGGSVRRRGLSREVIEATLLSVNNLQCDPPLDEDEVKRIAGSVARYDPAPSLPAIKVKPLPSTLAECIAAFQKWLHLPDPGALEVALGTYAANRLPGDPVWTAIVDASGGGKTEQIVPLAALPHVLTVSTLTEPSLLSGTSRRDKTKTATGGLLRQIGSFGVFILKDMGGVLSLRPETRASVLAALRELYDGHWLRAVGVDGGQTLEWTGKLGVIAAVTPDIDSHHQTLAALGERFIYYRVPEGDEERRALKAFEHAGRETEMRDQLRQAVLALFAGVALPDEPIPISNDIRDWLITLAHFTTHCRSAIRRNNVTRDIELVVGAEVPTRLTIVWAQLYRGLVTIGVEPTRALELLRRTAMSSMPQLRRRVIEYLAQSEQEFTSNIARALGYPTATIRRTLDELACYSVVERDDQGEGRDAVWRLGEWASKAYSLASTFPGKSHNAYCEII